MRVPASRGVEAVPLAVPGLLHVATRAPVDSDKGTLHVDLTSKGIRPKCALFCDSCPRPVIQNERYQEAIL